MTPFVSTGKLPPTRDVQRLVEAAHVAAAGITEGANSDVYPALQRVDPSLFGVGLVSTTGERFRAGDVAVPLVLMSVSKPFVFGLLCADLGPDTARDLIGVDPTGLPFNSVEAVATSADGRTNPMVNPGAIATTSHVLGRDAGERWQRIRAGLEAFAGHPLELDEEVYASVMATNVRNRELAAVLAERGRLGCAPEEAVELYSRQCCLQVTAEDLAMMAATLADGGKNPATGQQVIEPALVQPVLAVMATAGMYEHSGQWLYDVGLPAKSGISGGILAVAPGKGGMGSYSPPLDAAGNSVRGVRVATMLSQELGLAVFASNPV